MEFSVSSVIVLLSRICVRSSRCLTRKSGFFCAPDVRIPPQRTSAPTGRTAERSAAQDAPSGACRSQARPARPVRPPPARSRPPSGQGAPPFSTESADRTAEVPLLLVFIEADRKLSLRGALQRSGVARQGKHLRDAAALRLLRRRGGNLLPAFELFFSDFFVRPRNAARARKQTSPPRPAPSPFESHAQIYRPLAKAI